MVHPKKYLGQHFLTDHNIATKIAGCLSKTYAHVCELGPGTGILTQALLKNENIRQLSLIEIDSESVEYLRLNFHDSRINLFEQDFLKTDLKRLFHQSLALIGNFPYNISSRIFFRVIENRELFGEIVGMIQKEVAERIVASPGNKTYGIPSVLLQAWFDISYCFTVNETVFFPPPKVKSAVIHLKRNNTKQLSCNEKLFITVVKTAFNQRRKILSNALKPLCNSLPEHLLLRQRAEQLSVNDFVQITQMVEHEKSAR